MFVYSWVETYRMCHWPGGFKYCFGIVNNRNYRARMFRNSQDHKASRTSIYSPESKNHLSQLSIEDAPPLYHIEKGRALSHKKLSLISTVGREEQERPSVNFNKGATFEPNKFYRHPSKPSLLLQSKKSRAEDGKVSLKTSNYGFTHQRLASDNTIQINAIQQLQHFKKQMKDTMAIHLQGFERELKNQDMQILNLRQKIDGLMKEISARDIVIRQLTDAIHQQKNIRSPVKNTDSGLRIQVQKSDFIIKRIVDLEMSLKLIPSLCSEQQARMSLKMDEINSKLLHYIVLKKESNEKLQKANNKIRTLSFWGEQKVVQIQEQVQECCKKLVQNQLINHVYATLNALKKQIGALEGKSLCTTSTIGHTENWESFQDYVEHAEQINISRTSAGGDIFFYPNLHKTEEMMGSLCEKTTTFSGKQSSMFSQASTYKLESVVKMLISQHEKQLPLECQLDKFNRLVPQSTGRPLRNEQSECYYKFSEREIEFLERGNYVKLF